MYLYIEVYICMYFIIIVNLPIYRPSLETSSCHTPRGDSPHICTDMNGQELKPARDES